MNVASILPLAAVSSATSTASTSAPSGFLDALATQVTAGGDAASPSDDSGTGTDDDAEGLAQDLLTLAALASRTASATLPHLPVVTTTEGAGEGGDATGDEPVSALSALQLTEAADLVAPDAGSEAVADEAAADSPDLTRIDGDDVVAAAEDTAPVVVSADEPSVDAGGDTDGDATAVSTPDDAAASADVPAEPEATVASEPAADDGAGPVVTSGPEDGRAVEVDGTATPDDDATTPRPDRATPATPVERGRGRTDDVAARPRLDGVGSARTAGVDAPVSAGPAVPGVDRVASPTPSTAAQRVLDIVSQLEDAPPPRVVVIETGEIRLRLGLDGGTVRMTVLGPLGEAGEAILQEAGEALEAGGFGTELDRGDEGDDRGADGSPRDRDAPRPFTPRTRPTVRSRAGLQL